ncbi:CDP-diacylglycerol--glycerol-3-phosphate 3-phosphatidyltransferase [Vulgatibacter incomptus]|uniref:CDP-diacylglycerol--glycerol-3-phosphate 3-phosphatidyltransferase n=1 Tax=Vulgatibacter incomptus TaxID=1391653 RepID=A0A0K1PBY1_9BACT|nr:CDP-diacylglycerol--glycerol-3-phosphate 3-phosphatidyltransferase [Vulgatibacter incomptus]AKU91007.1 CDP-diacylglycerol--glycerol-3-phosphate 3-phosphatidyltransferase [Vulgatibacter incomptus]
MAAKKVAARRPLKDELVNLPNLITYLRILVIPVFLWFVWRGDPFSSFVAAVLFTFAAISDMVDGWLARRMNLVSVVGKLMDPLADKLIVTAALVMLAQMGRIEAWLVIVILSRELIVSGLRQIAIGEGLVIAAGQGGKWKTALQLTGIIGVLVHYTYPIDLLVVSAYPFDFQLIGEWILVVSLAPSILSALRYFADFLAAVAQKERASQAGARRDAA